MPARTRSFVPAIALGCAVLALLMLGFPAMAAPPPVAPQAPSGFLVLVVNYSHDWVSASTTPLAAVQVTVKRAGVTVATVSGQADAGGNFRSDDNPWSPSRPDILVGDVVEATSPGATAAVSPVGEIAGTLSQNKVSGQIHAGHLAPANLTVRCEVWAESGGWSPIVVPNVPAGGGTFSCDFGAQGHSLAPGNMVAVTYFEPDGDQVIRVFRVPAPDLRVNMWTEGGQDAGVGGLSVFHVSYRNEGEEPAENVLLTDTLPAGVTFVSSTSAVVPVVSGGSVKWSLGRVMPGGQIHFFVVLRNALAAGQSFNNVMDISTTSQGDELGNNHSEATVQVTSGLPDVNVGQWVNPRDVLIGDTCRVVVNYGNNGPVPAGPVRLRVQLDPGVTLEGWSSENGYGSLWKLTSSAGGNLVFDAAALPGSWGDRLLLDIGVPASLPADKELISTVSIEAPQDPNTGNNGPSSQSVWTTKEQRPDLRIEKRWSYGQLTPGGHGSYNLSYSNDGNLTQQNVRLTDTLPEGTSFVTSTVNSSWGDSYPVPPVSNESGKLTWDLGTLRPGQWGSFQVEVALDGVQAGATITNTADIQGLDRDRSWWNNHSSDVEKVNGPGPNLRLRSESFWEWPGQVRFELYFENVGTIAVDGVQIVDTLPAGLEFNGDWWPNWWRDMNMTYNPSTRQITWTTSRLEPNWSGKVSFRANVPAADIGKQGVIHENRAQITLAQGELTPADNSTTATAFTGPDLYVEKSLWDGKLAAGEVVTFTVTFGNRNNGPWSTGNPPEGSPGVKLVDTLPEGMTLLSANVGPTPWPPAKQEGNVLTWTAYGVCPGCQSQMMITVRIANTLPGRSVLTNKIDIVDMVPGDVDPFPNNNAASWQGTLAPRELYLPLLSR